MVGLHGSLRVLGSANDGIVASQSMGFIAIESGGVTPALYDVSCRVNKHSAEPVGYTAGSQSVNVGQHPLLRYRMTFEDDEESMVTGVTHEAVQGMKNTCHGLQKLHEGLDQGEVARYTSRRE